MPSITDAIRELQTYPAWVCYIFLDPATEQLILNQDPDGPKPTKPPINPRKGIYGPVKTLMASVKNPDTWGTYQEAAKRLIQGRKAGYRGLGYVFSLRDPFCGIDLDNIRDPETGEIIPWAWDIIRALNSYTEISVSGTGVHIIIRGSLAQLLKDMGLTEEELRHRHPKGIEIYDNERYFTVSAKHLEGTPTTIEPRQQELETLYFETFCIEEEGDQQPDQDTLPQQGQPATHQEKHKERGASAERPDEPAAAGIQFTITDEFILEQAAKARGGRGAVFERLMAGDTSDFPGPAGKKKDDTSRADLALCGIFAYWTRCDATQMDRLFRKSGLYTKSAERRKKWDRYGDRTIRLAIKNCRSMYNPAWADEHRKSSQRTEKKQARPTTNEQAQETQEENRQFDQKTRKRAFPHIETITQGDMQPAPAAAKVSQPPRRAYTYAEHRATLDASLERMKRRLAQVLDDPGDTKIYLISRPPGTGKT